MKRFITSISGILVLAAITVLINGLSSKLLAGWSWDITKDKLYSLSQGSVNILNQIPKDNGLTLRLFFSSTDGRSEPGFVFYGNNVRDLLEEYSRRSGGKLKLETYDPRPDSDEEEWAFKYGLQPMNTQSGAQLFLGVVVTDEQGKEASIPTFDFGRQSFLEYDITKLIFSVLEKEKPRVGILSSISLEGDPASRYMQGGSKPWFFLSQLKDLADVETLDAGSQEIGTDIKLLVVVHPKGFSQKLLYAIDQFVMEGGSLLVLEDPYCEAEVVKDQANPMAAMSVDKSSNLNQLLAKWGVEMEAGNSVGDVSLGAAVSMGGGGQPVTFMLWPNLHKDNIASDDLAVADLENILLPWVGSLKITPQQGVEYKKLLTSSNDAVLVSESQYRFQGGNPESLLATYDPKSGGERIFAVRIRGSLSSAFPAGKPIDPPAEGEVAQPPMSSPDPSHIGVSKKPANVVVVADADFISDRYSVVLQNLFGQTLATPRNDNLSLFLNLVDNLVGSNDLIGIRSRGQFSRPFTKVQALERKAQQSLKSKEQELQASLMRANERLKDLQEQGGSQNKKVLNKALLDEINTVRAERQSVMKQVREVRREFREDIESLGDKLFLLNTVFIPALLVIVSLFWYLRKRR